MLGLSLTDVADPVVTALVGILGVAGGLYSARRSQRVQEAQTRAEHEAQETRMKAEHAAQETRMKAEHAERLRVLRLEQANAEERQLKNEMLTTAAALAGELTSAYFRIVQLSENNAGQTLDEIQRTLDTATIHLGRTSLLFEPRSPTTQSAEGAYQNIRTLLQLRRAQVEKRPDTDQAAVMKRFEAEDQWAGTNLADFKSRAFAGAAAVTERSRDSPTGASA